MLSDDEDRRCPCLLCQLEVAPASLVALGQLSTQATPPGGDHWYRQILGDVTTLPEEDMLSPCTQQLSGGRTGLWRALSAAFRAGAMFKYLLRDTKLKLRYQKEETAAAENMCKEIEDVCDYKVKGLEDALHSAKADYEAHLKLVSAGHTTSLEQRDAANEALTTCKKEVSRLRAENMRLNDSMHSEASFERLMLDLKHKERTASRRKEERNHWLRKCAALGDQTAIRYLNADDGDDSMTELDSDA